MAPVHGGRLAELRNRRHSREPLPIREEPKARSISFRWMALAAAALVLVFVSGAVLSGPLGLGGQQQSAESDVGDAVATASRILADPNHLEARLTTPDGQAGGTALLAGTSQDIVIVSSVLKPSDTTYDCYVISGGAPTWIGRMQFYGTTSYWEGTLPPGTADHGDQVQVRAGGASGPVALMGTF